MVTYGELYRRIRFALEHSEGHQAGTIARELMALASGYEWEYRGIEYKITYSEIVRMAENGHRISWHYIGGRQAIGITYTDGIALVIFTDEERLLTGLGHYYLTF